MTDGAVPRTEVERVVVDCYNCGSPEHEHYLSENGFAMVRCLDCGMLYVRERPSDELIDDSTALGEHLGEQNLHVDVRYNPAVQARYRHALPRLFPEGLDAAESWLDVGCGHGEFIEVVAGEAPGLRVSGCEPNRTKQRSAQSRGLDVTFFDLSAHTTQYSVVSLLNVFSHLAHPREMIADLARLVEPGGSFVLQTGDAAHLTPSEMLRPMCLPDHLSFASYDILESMITDAGLSVTQVVRYPALERSPRQVVREVVKAVSPRHRSYLRHYRHWQKYAGVNVWIRAERT
ncbi:MAG: class I SAM-dependent methyltransferase [Actinomycetota bacterium]